MTLNTPDPTDARPSTAGTWHSSAKIKIALLSVFVLTMLIPFVDKPFHIDDPMYVWTARQIVAHPFDYYGFKVNWEGQAVPVSHFNENPPLVAYYLAAVSPIARWTEIGFHSAFLPFAVASVIGLYKLAGRFCNRPGLVAILLIASPGFIVSSTTLMCEPPLLALWIWTIWLWIEATDRKPSLLPVAGLLASAAILTKFSGMSLLPLMGLYAAVTPGDRKLRIRQILSLLIPVVTVLGYELLSKKLYGIGALGGASKYVAQTHAWQPISWTDSTVNTVTFIGGSAIPIALLAIPLVFRASVAILSVAIVLPIIVIALVSPRSLPVGFVAQAALMTVAGGVVLALVFVAGKTAWQSRRWRDDAFLIGWMGGVFFFTAGINWSINVRSVLPMIPPLAILIGRAIDRTKSIPKIWPFASVVIGVCVSLLVARGDYQQAVTGKMSAEQLTAGKTAPVYFCGHWGFQYYMQPLGGEIIDEFHPQVHPGDQIIYARSGLGGTPRSTGLEQISTIHIGPDSWTATQIPTVGSGFYSSLGHALPYVFGPVGGETFDIKRVTPTTKIKT